MRNKRNENRVHPLEIPFDTTNPNHNIKPNFNFFQTYNGTITRYRLNVKGDTPRFEYFLNIQKPEKIVKGIYIIILKKINGKTEEIYSLETSIEVKKYTTIKNDGLRDKPLNSIFTCRFYIGLDCDIRCGKYDLYLYKQVIEQKTLISYLYNDKKILGSYVTFVSIHNVINGHHGDKIDHIPRINFKKNQLVPIGDKYIIVIDNEHEFVSWLDNKVTTNFGVKSDLETQERIRKAIKEYLITDSSVTNQLHPSYIEDICDTLVTSVQTELTTNFFDLYVSDYIRKHILNVSKPQFSQIMNQRIKKYEKIFTETGLNIEKITIFLKEYNLDVEYLTKIIKDNYHWFIINEAVETVKKYPNYPELKENMGKITNEVYILFKKILAFETKHYKEEKDVNKI